MTFIFDLKLKGQGLILFSMVDCMWVQRLMSTHFDQLLVRYCDLSAFTL